MATNAKAYGPPADAPQNWRLIATKISDDEFTENIDAVTSDGTWRRSVSLAYRRVISKSRRFRQQSSHQVFYNRQVRDSVFHHGNR
jgi:hypothetical protein